MANTTPCIGIIGGLGAETNCSFCLDLNNHIRKQLQKQPSLILENLPISIQAEQNIINGNSSTEHIVLLAQAVQRLNSIPVDCIVIPCNTVHTFLPELRSISKIPILSIMEECVKECQQKKLTSLGLLATTKTIQEQLFQKECNKENITIILPNSAQQQDINQIILNIINQNTTPKDSTQMLKIIHTLKQQGAQAIILGCTDLSLLITQNLSPLPLIDTTEVLLCATINRILTPEVCI